MATVRETMAIARQGRGAARRSVAHGASGQKCVCLLDMGANAQSLGSMSNRDLWAGLSIARWAHG